MESDEENEHVTFNKVVLDIKKINLDISKPINCMLNFACSIFPSKTSQSTDGTSKYFKLSPSQTHEHDLSTEGFIEHTIQLKESNLKKILQSNLMMVEVYDNNEKIGMCSINLSSIFGPEAEDRPFGLRCDQKGKIVDKCGRIIGSVEFYIVLEQEKCKECQGCKDFFRPKLIVTHIIRNKSCKNSYTEKEIQSLKDDSIARQKKIRNRKNWAMYDPLKRSQLHAKYYNPNDRSEKHASKRQEENVRRGEAILNAHNNGRAELAKSKNLEEFQNKKTYFKRAKDLIGWEQLSLLKETMNSINDFKNEMSAINKKLEVKINKTVDFVTTNLDLKRSNDNDKSMSFALRDIDSYWNKMSDKVSKDWYKLGVKMDLAFKNIARNEGMLEDIIDSKFDEIREFI